MIRRYDIVAVFDRVFCQILLLVFQGFRQFLSLTFKKIQEAPWQKQFDVQLSNSTALNSNEKHENGNVKSTPVNFIWRTKNLELCVLKVLLYVN